MKVKNYYKLLKIEASSNLVEIKKAFRKEIAIYHPDINTSKDAEKQFDDLVEAFDILSKPDKRKLYDKLLKANYASNTKPIKVDAERKKAFEQWKEEAKEKSKEYKKKHQDDSTALDFFPEEFIESMLEGLINNTGDLLEGTGNLLEGAADIIGDILGDL